MHTSLKRTGPVDKSPAWRTSNWLCKFLSIIALTVNTLHLFLTPLRYGGSPSLILYWILPVIIYAWFWFYHFKLSTPTPLPVIPNYPHIMPLSIVIVLWKTGLLFVYLNYGIVGLPTSFLTLFQHDHFISLIQDVAFFITAIPLYWL